MKMWQQLKNTKHYNQDYNYYILNVLIIDKTEQSEKAMNQGKKQAVFRKACTEPKIYIIFWKAFPLCYILA